MTHQPQHTVPEGSVVIQPAQVYAEVVKLTQVVTQLVERDNADQKNQERLTVDVADLKREKADKATVDRLIDEVSNLKTRVYVAAGFFAGIGALGGGALSTVIR